MNHRLAHLLMLLYPRLWRKRYGSEFEALLQTGGCDLRTLANVVWSALCEHIFRTGGDTTNQHTRSSRFQSSQFQSSQFQSSQFQSWCVRAPWAVFGLAPLLFLARAYFIACSILWSGWKIFLPGTNTPFVPIDGFAIFYFGVGRLLYYGAPILIGWGVGLIAIRQQIGAIWPSAGLVLIALISTGAQVHASRPVLGGAGHISMQFVLGHSVQDISSGLLHALVIFLLMVLPYLIWRLQKARSPSA